MDGGVHVHGERVADALDADVLVKRVRIAVLGQHANVAFTVGDLVVTGGVVGYVCVRDVLDMPHDAVKNLGNLQVCLVIHGDDFARGPVLPLVVGDLTNVLRQLVDGQTGAGIDGLPLHRPSGRENVCWPLPIIIRASGKESQVVQFVFTGVAIRRDSLRKASPCGSEDVSGILGTPRLGAVCHLSRANHAGVSHVSLHAVNHGEIDDHRFRQRTCRNVAQGDAATTSAHAVDPAVVGASRGNAARQRDDEDIVAADVRVVQRERHVSGGSKRGSVHRDTTGGLVQRDGGGLVGRLGNRTLSSGGVAEFRIHIHDVRTDDVLVFVSHANRLGIRGHFYAPIQELLTVPSL